MSVFVWTVGGVVLAARSGGTRIVESVDGGARIYVDENGNGQIDAGEAGPYVTDGSGFADIPWGYRGYSIIADVTGAVDVETGEVLTGTFRSLRPEDPAGEVIATPLTDLLADAEDPQGVLDVIFGAGVVTVSQVTDPGYYRLVSPGEKLAAPMVPAAYEADLADYVSKQITRASIALTELKADAGVAGAADISTSSALAEVVRDALKAKDPNNKNSLDGLRDKIAAREGEAGLIAEGKPIAVGGAVSAPPTVSR
jgi:hypothetical protein